MNSAAAWDASQYKDYVLFMLFIKYVSDKYGDSDDFAPPVTPEGIANSSAVLHPAGTVVLSRDAGVGKSAIMRTEMAVSQHFMAWSCGSELDNHFLYYWLQSAKPEFERIANGSTIKTTGLPYFQALRFPKPPLPEQHAIATALSDVDGLLGGLDQLIAKKRDLKQAVMQQLLTGKTRLPGLAPASEKLKQTEVGVIPEDWDVRPLLSTVRIANGQVSPKVEPYKSMVLVAPDHIESSTGNLLAKETAAEQGAISGKYLFESGDIVYSKIRPYLRKAILADFSGLCSADMYPLKPATDISSGYIFAAILGYRFTKYAESVSVRSGMPKINRTEMADFSLAVPPLREQTAIAEVLTEMDAELAALEQRREKTRALKQAMMQELLTGRTRLI